MRGALRTAAGLAFAWLAIGTAPAWGAGTQVSLLGSIEIGWRGDPARGCAESGLCGVTGALEASPSGTTGVSSGTPPVELDDGGAVARVNTQLPGGGLVQCADVAPIDLSFVVVRSPGPPHAVLDPKQVVQLPIGGRCAGPVGTDLAGLRLPARRVKHGWDLSGIDTFGGGPFQITVRSSLRAVFAPLDSGGSAPIPGLPSPSRGNAPKPRRVLDESVEIRYRIAGAPEPLAVTFSGTAAPSCAPLGACGTTGTLSTTLAGSPGTFSLFGDRIVAHRQAARRVLADVRAGRFRLFANAELTLTARTSATLVSAGGTACRDETTNGQIPISADIAHGRDTFVVGPAGQRGPFVGPFGSADALRTRCSGPSSDDVLGAGPLATASIPISALGDRQLTMPLTADRSFRTIAYQGTLRGSTALNLTLRRIVVRTARTEIFPGASP